MGSVIAGGLAAAMLIGGSMMMWQSDTPLAGDGSLITAPKGAYKVRPETPGGMTVEGQGDSSFAASEGGEVTGRIDLASANEEPVMGSRAANATPSGSSTGDVAVPDSGGNFVTPAPEVTQAGLASDASSGTMAQLGSFDSAAQATAAWGTMSKRFGYLAPLPMTVATGQVGGRTVYRLRVAAGDEAATICGKLKVAGENCLVVN